MRTTQQNPLVWFLLLLSILACLIAPQRGVTVSADIGGDFNIISQSSTTLSGISAGNITITDNARQIELTGKDGKATVAGLATGITTDSNTSGALTKAWNEKQLQKNIDAQISITQTFSQFAPKAVADYASQQAASLQAQAEQAAKENDPGKAAELQAEAKKWDEGGAYRIALHTVTGALSGGLSGAAGAATAAGAAPLLQSLQTATEQALTEQGLGSSAVKAIAQGLAEATAIGLGAAVGGSSGAVSSLVVDTNNRQLHPDEKKIIRTTIASQYIKDHPGVTLEQADQILEAQLSRQVDSKAGAAGGWDQDASNYLNAYKSSHAGVNVGTDQWGNAVPLFGVAAGYQRSDSTIFSANPQTSQRPPTLDGSSVLNYAKGIGSGIADTLGHPIDTLINGVTNLYNTITDPQGTATKLQSDARVVVGQAGDGNFTPAGQQVGQQIGGTVVGTAIGIGVSTTVGAIDGAVSNLRGANSGGTRANIPTTTSISKVELNASVDDGMQYVQYQNGSNWIWPSNLGFTGAKVETTMPVGTILDRIGEPSGSFLSPAGTAFEQRALAPGTGASAVYTYEVIKPLPVVQGEIAPAFGQAGGGIQILPNVGQKVNVEWLIKNGYLKEIKK